MGETTPPGYERIQLESRVATVQKDIAPAIAEIIRTSTLYDHARSRPDVVMFRGRGDVPSFRLEPPGIPIVVRRSRHGGALAGITRDLFVRPGRAPEELQLSLDLLQRGVPTPKVLGYVLYLLPGGLCRSDVITRRVESASDLATYLASTSAPYLRQAALRATATLLVALETARVHHPDLNMRNILLSNEADGMLAWLLDVDRVILGQLPAVEAGAANVRRLLRSARKLREQEGLAISDGELAQLVGHSGIAA